MEYVTSFLYFQLLSIFLWMILNLLIGKISSLKSAMDGFDQFGQKCRKIIHNLIFQLCGQQDPLSNEIEEPDGSTKFQRIIDENQPDTLIIFMVFLIPVLIGTSITLRLWIYAFLGTEFAFRFVAGIGLFITSLIFRPSLLALKLILKAIYNRPINALKNIGIVWLIGNIYPLTIKSSEYDVLLFLSVIILTSLVLAIIFSLIGFGWKKLSNFRDIRQPRDQSHQYKQSYWKKISKLFSRKPQSSYQENESPVSFYIEEPKRIIQSPERNKIQLKDSQNAQDSCGNYSDFLLR